MFWNKKKPKSKPQIKTTVPKAFKAKEPPPKWQPTFGETKKKDEKPPEVTTKSESKIDWENKFLKSFQKLTYRHRSSPSSPHYEPWSHSTFSCGTKALLYCNSCYVPW